MYSSDKSEKFVIGAKVIMTAKREDARKSDYFQGTIIGIDERNSMFHYLVRFEKGALKWMSLTVMMNEYGIQR